MSGIPAFSSRGPARAADWLMLLVLAGGCLALGWLSGLANQEESQRWYAGLAKPAGTPPDWAFPVAWTLLYLLMGAAAWLVWRAAGVAGARVALGLFVLQLALNLAWTPAFFGLQDPDLGLVVILLVDAAVAATILAFRRHRPAAALLLLPYLAWVLFATWLNFGTWRLNG